MLPRIAIGAERMSRSLITERSAAGALARDAFFGDLPPMFVSRFDITGDLADVGMAPLIAVRRGPLVAVDVSGAKEGTRYYQRKGALVAGGLVTVEPRMMLANADNTHTYDISWVMQSGRVTLDPLADPIWKFEGNALLSDFLPEKYQDWIAPIMDVTTSRADGLGRERNSFQLGLYRVRPYPKAMDQWGGTVQMRGYDALWTLRTDIVGAPYSVAAGTNYSVKIREILEARGFTRHSIQSTSATLPKKRTWESNVSWLQVLNDLAKENGFYALSPDHAGIIRSRRFQRIGDLDPAVSYGANDIVDTVLLDPDEERFANHVVVEGNSPSGTSFRRELINKDPASKASTVSLNFTKSIHERSPDFKSQAAVDARAEYLMERANSMQVRMQVRTKMLRQFSIHEAIKFNFDTNSGQEVARGKWRLERVTIDMGLNCQPEWIVSQLEPFEEVL